ncbi:hypothetical protein HN51_029336 [Arachis hypogaea]
MDFSGFFDSEGEDSFGSVFDDGRRRYSASDDNNDDDENLECNEAREGRENSEGGADDRNGMGDADDASEGGLRRPVRANDFLGKEFAAEDDAYAAYKEFAKIRGFEYGREMWLVWMGC